MMPTKSEAPEGLAADQGRQGEGDAVTGRLSSDYPAVNPLDACAGAMREAGIPCSDSICPDGKIHRYPTKENGHDKDGWYVLFDNGDGFYAGAFGCWRSGVEETWTSKGNSKQLTDKEREQIQRAKQRAAEEREKAQAEAARRAREIYESLPSVQDHPYLALKGIKPLGAYPPKAGRDGRLVVPLYDMEGEFRSLQYIPPDGKNKKFLTDGQITGNFNVIDGDDQFIVIAEGYATAVSIHEATGSLVVAALNAGNLKPVAERFKKHHPSKKLIIAADNDRWSTHSDGRMNPGLIKAQEAAEAVDGQVVCPEFKTEHLKQRPTDFNDLALLEGIDAVKKAFKNSQPASLKLTDWIASRAFPGTPGNREWLISGKVPMGQVTVLASAGGIGKSGECVCIAAEVARDIISGFQRPRIGSQVQVYGMAVYLSGEDDQLELHGRLHHLQATQLKNLIAVPLPSVGGAQAFFKMDPNTREPVATPAFYDFTSQLRSLDNLKVVIIDPLQVFCHLDLNLPENAQAVCSKLSALASETGAAVIITHHFRKTKVNGPESAREAIRGTAGLVDGVRSVYALWLPSSENSKSNPRALCRRLGVKYAPDKIVQGAIVKANGDADKSISTFVRDERGFLEDMTSQVAYLDVNADLGDDLVEHIAQAAREGRPYTKTYINGLYERRHEMSERFHMVGKNKFVELADELLQIGKLTMAMGPGSKAVKWLDVPDGPFARGEGVFAEGSSVTE
jgi:phage/plasmid primase-like uncharacterized protein